MWLTTVLFFVLFVIFIIFGYKYMSYKPRNFPPGPFRIPVFGSYLWLLLENFNFPHFTIQKWAKKYGNVMGMYVADFPCVFACDYESVKEVLNRPEFDGKPEIFSAKIRALDKDLGIFFTDGPFWHEQRRFSLRYLRDFGFGRRFEKLEVLIEEQLQSVVDQLRDKKPIKEDMDIWKDNSVEIQELLFPCMGNSILSIFGMEPAQYGTKRYTDIRRLGRGIMTLQRGFFAFSMVNFQTWLRFIIPKMTGYKNLMDSNKVIHPFVKDVIEENKKTMLDDEIRNFWDMYLKRLQEENKEMTTFSEEQLHMITIDYIFPAISATTGTIVYIMQYMLHYPEIQEKMFKEIEEVVGRSRLPNLDDRKDLSYTEAVLREVMRIDTLVPLGIVHNTIEDTKFRGYDIPKNTLIYTSLYGAHMDEKIWGDPKVFRPERFIGPDGKIVKKDYSLPFGAGKRLCAGETFARNAMFLMLACLVQNFVFTIPKGAKIPSLQNRSPGLANFVSDPLWIVAEPRN